MDQTKPFIKDTPVFADDRGTFVPFLDGPEPSVRRVYYVVNPASGTIRGFHFHKVEWKYFTIVRGSAKFVAINPDKPEEKFTFVSSDRKPNTIVIPPGFANGWISLEDRTILVCGSSSTTQESLADDNRFDPLKWGDVWSVKAR